MKKLSLIIFSLVVCVNVFASSFCDGFKQGYISGYKQAANTNLLPLAPLCPIQPLKGFGSPSSDYEHGYLIGVQKGTADAYAKGVYKR